MIQIGDRVKYRLAFSGKIKEMRVDEILQDEYYKGQIIYRLRNPNRPKTDIHGILVRPTELEGSIK